MFNLLKKNKYIVITDHECYVGPTEESVNNQAGGLIDAVEYKRIGDYYVSILNPSDYSFVQDKRRFANIPWKTLGKEARLVGYVPYVIILLQLITLMKAG